MSKRIARIIYAAILGLIVPLVAYADYPHTGPTSAGIDCLSCHVVHGPLPSWATVTPANIDDTPYNNLCQSCHNNVRATYEKTHSSINTSATYSNWTAECRTCHESHKQEQARTYGAAAYLDSGVISAITDTVITRSTGTAWAVNEWAGTLLVIGDVTTPSAIFYKITGNTANTLTASEPVAANPGDTFAIVFGTLVRNQITYLKTSLSSTITSSVKFLSNVGPDSYADGISTVAVCVVCHTQTKYHKRDGTGQPHHEGQDCIPCHSHEEGFKPSCAACHGQPPATGSHVFHATSTGRNYTCDTCHFNSVGTGPFHDDGKVSLGFNIFNGASAVGAYDGGTGTTYEPTNAGTIVSNGGSQKCSNIYCHGSTLSGGTNTTPSWGDNTTAVCGSCHGATASNPPTAGAHPKHAGQYAFPCADCHFGFVPSAIPSGMSTHVDNTVDVAFPGAGSFSSGNCSNLYCHSDGVGTFAAVAWSWTLNPDCTSCHGGDALSVRAIATNAHAAHTNSPTTVGFTTGCVECHSATVVSDTVILDRTLHVNQSVNVRFDNGVRNKDSDAPAYNGNPANSTVAGGSSKAAGSTVGSCSNVYCHSSGNVNSAGTASPPVTFRTIAWNAAPIACDGCHGDQAGRSWPVYPTGAAGSQTANSHVKHVESSSLTCDFCHMSTTVSTVTTPATMTVIPGGTHLNRTNDISFKTNGGKTGSYAAATKTCSATYCHGVSAQQWGGPALSCTNCHDASNTGLSGRHDIHYNSATAATSLAGGMNIHTATTYVFACLNCHPTNQHSTGPNTINFQDANVGGTKIAAYTAGVTSSADMKGFIYTNNGTCNTTPCHTRDGISAAPITTPTWSGAVTGSCGVCHNKAGDAAPVWTAPHTKHINSYSVNTNFTCNTCHAGTATDNATINGAAGRNQHPDGIKNIQFNAFANSAATGTAGVGCTNTYCHGNGQTTTPISSSTVSWSGTMTCGSCHGDASTLASGAHAKHLAASTALGPITCDDCHNATAANNTTLSAATGTVNHVNQSVTIQLNAGSASSGATYGGSPVGGASVLQKAVGSPKGTCNITYCHGVKSGVWDVVNNDATCVKCHGVVSTTTASYTADPRRASPGYIVSSPAGTGYNTAGVFGTLTGFNSVSTDTKVGAHNAHIGSTGGYSAQLACSVCHENVVSAATAGHMGGSTTFAWSSPSNTGGLSPSYNASTATCSATYCHGNWFPPANQGTGTAPVWTDASYITSAAGSLTNCQICHLSPPLVEQDGVTSHPSATLLPTPNCNGCHGHNGSGSTHIDGVLQASAGDCVSCHSTVQTAPKASIASSGTVTQRDAVVGEFGLAWGHKNSVRGAVTAADCIVCHLEGNYTTQQQSSVHGDGYIHLRDPDGAGETQIADMSGATYSFVSFATSYAAGARTSTGNTANTVDNILTQKFCLACHDSNGATNPTARSNNGGTGTQYMPFGGINLGANYTVANGAAVAGGLVDVKTQLSTTNSSKHPVMGPLTKDFPTPARLAVPYNNFTRAGTSGTKTAGVVITCFDCHNAGTSVTNRTIVSHGSMSTINGTLYATAAGGNSVTSPTFCLNCHIGGYDTSTGHGAGTAVASINSNMNSARFAPCANCHFSSGFKPVRPAQAADVHGFNGLLSTGGPWTYGSGSGMRPISFMRNVGRWVSTSPRPYTAPGLTGTGAQCGGNLNTSTGGVSCNENMTTYSPGGSY